MSESEARKSSIMPDLDRMNLHELTELIQNAEKKRQEKLEAAKRDLIEEFQSKASKLGIPLSVLLADSGVQRLENKPKKGGSGKLSAKYRGPNGEEWSGRGRLPNWLSELESAGRKREEYSVKESA
ncbi:MAG: H-NS histone family protein [Rhodospirillales bacterium]|jgi:DNA-binding protein H-NS|nr:H-NS histone family protein [Rhodospirillales bacterium]